MHVLATRDDRSLKHICGALEIPVPLFMLSIFLPVSEDKWEFHEEVVVYITDFFDVILHSLFAQRECENSAGKSPRPRRH